MNLNIFIDQASVFTLIASNITDSIKLTIVCSIVSYILLCCLCIIQIVNVAAPPDPGWHLQDDPLKEGQVASPAQRQV